MLNNSFFSICITAFNEENNIPSLFNRVNELVELCPEINEIVIVNNGSQDGTSELLSALAINCKKTIVDVEQNLGYGNGMKRAVLGASNNLILLLHADDQYETEDIALLFERFKSMSNVGPIMLKGRRINREDPIFVRTLSKLNSLFVSIFSGKIVRDSNGIPKIFDVSRIKSIIELLPNNAAFDGALCVAWSRRGGLFVEVPVRYRDRTVGAPSWYGKKIRIAISMFRELFLFSMMKDLVKFNEK